MDPVTGDAGGRTDHQVPTTGRLRRPTLVSTPLLLVSLMGAGLTLWLILWGLWYSEPSTAQGSGELGASFWVPLILTSAITIGAFVLSRGCYIDVSDDTVRDVVSWVAIKRIDRQSIVTVNVRQGFWRLFELTLDDGSVRVLLGASPTQFPARLLASAEAQDLADIGFILGE